MEFSYATVTKSLKEAVAEPLPGTDSSSKTVTTSVVCADLCSVQREETS